MAGVVGVVTGGAGETTTVPVSVVALPTASVAVTETAYEPTAANVRVTLAPDPEPPSPNVHAIDETGDHASIAGH